MVLLSDSMHTIVKTHSKLIYKLHFHPKIMFLPENDVNSFESKARAGLRVWKVEPITVTLPAT